jgi:D-glycerate 3-kinase
MSNAAAVLSFARRGPLFRRLGAAAPPAAEWQRHGEALAAQLLPPGEGAAAAGEGGGGGGGGEPKSITLALRDRATAGRIFHLYLPIYFWCKALVVGEKEKQKQKEEEEEEEEEDVETSAIGIGLSAVQGCGKTTLVRFLTDRFAADGLVCAAVSFDDFYLTGADQDAVAAAHPDNPLLQVRGNAGTHDLALGTETIARLLRREVGVNVPRYDKSARSGRGDRAPITEWTRVEQAPDVVLLEGWMAGFAPLVVQAGGGSAKSAGEREVGGAGGSGGMGGDGDAAAAETTGTPVAPVPPAFEKGMGDVNRMLAEYSAWHDCMSAWVVVSIDEYDHVYRWRLEAERAMAASGKPGMSDEQLQDFVSRYMPAYRAYLPGLYAAANDGGPGVCGRPTLRVEVDGNRQVVADKC